MTATLITSGLCGLLLVVLSFRVIRLRLRRKVSMGDNGDAQLQSRVRAHANFTEYFPVILILIGLVEMRVGATGVLTAAGALLVLGRIAHAIGMERPAPNPWRAGGVAATMTLLIGLSLWALVLGLAHA